MYCDDFSKSINAAQAENFGIYSLTQSAKLLGVSPEAIKENMGPDEWHHTSKYYNRTDYYNIQLLLEIKNGTANYTPEDNEYEQLEEARELLEKLKAYKKPKLTENKYFAEKVKYVIWSGTRNFPKATEYVFENIEVVEKGQFYIFLTPKGPVRKKIGSNGTYVDSNKRVKQQYGLC